MTEQKKGTKLKKKPTPAELSELADLIEAILDRFEQDEDVRVGFEMGYRFSTEVNRVPRRPRPPARRRGSST